MHRPSKHTALLQESQRKNFVKRWGKFHVERNILARADRGAMTGLFWVPYILDRINQRGLAGAMANPGPNDKPQSAWARRMMAAHANATENLVIFAPLVLVTQTLGIATAITLSPARCISGRGLFMSWFTRSAFPGCARSLLSGVSWPRCCWCWRSSN
jgi:uncharacterized MAPEG superfamily protein